MKKFVLLAIACIFFTSIASAFEAPKLTGYVNDYAEMMSSKEESDLHKSLLGYENATSNQIFILTTPTLEGMSIQEYSLKVAETWQPGQKGKDNGILIVIAKKERKIRIETGVGTQGVLTDTLAGRIIDKKIVPYLKQGKTATALSAGIEEIKKALEGEFIKEVSTPKNSEPTIGLKLLLLLGLIFAFVIVVNVIAATGRKSGNDSSALNRRTSSTGPGGRSRRRNYGTESTGPGAYIPTSSSSRRRSSDSDSSSSDFGFSGGGGGSFDGGGADSDW